MSEESKNILTDEVKRKFVENMMLPLPRFDATMKLCKMAEKLGRPEYSDEAFEGYQIDEFERNTSVVYYTVQSIINNLFEKYKGKEQLILKDESMRMCQRIAQKYKLSDRFNSMYKNSRESWKTTQTRK